MGTAGDRVRGAGVWRTAVRCRAVIGKHRLAEAELAPLARIKTLAHLRAGRALPRIPKIGGGAGVRQADRPRQPGNGATAEAVAPVRDDLPTSIDADLRLRGRQRAHLGVRHRVYGVVRTAQGGAERIALEPPHTVVVAGSRVTVEETICLARVGVVAGNSPREGRLVIVVATDAFGIVVVDLAIAVIVDPVRACRPEATASSAGARGACPVAAAEGAAPAARSAPGARRTAAPAPPEAPPTPTGPLAPAAPSPTVAASFWSRGRLHTPPPSRKRAPGTSPDDTPCLVDPRQARNGSRAGRRGAELDVQMDSAPEPDSLEEANRLFLKAGERHRRDRITRARAGS